MATSSLVIAAKQDRNDNRISYGTAAMAKAKERCLLVFDNKAPDLPRKAHHKPRNDIF
tara:strand:- start:30 stop:203 length:174 start_codon:yes stop_codon:yes gene_type:complete